MKKAGVVAAAAGVLSLAIVAACVGDEPPAPAAPVTDGGTTPPPGSGSPPGTTNDSGAGDASQPFCATVPDAGTKESVFCEDFEGDYASRWTLSSGDGTMTTTDVGGYKALDVTLNATSADDYTGPRLLWRKIPEGGKAEVSFDFMLLEAPKPAADGFLWFARIGTFGNVGIGFGAELSNAMVDYTAITSTGPNDFGSETKFTFAPNLWMPVTLRYESTETGSKQLVSVPPNDDYAATLTADDLGLLANDIVFLGVFTKGGALTAHARFAHVVIRVTAP